MKTKTISQAIQLLRFPTIVFVALLHSFTVVQNNDWGPVYKSVTYFTSLILGEIGVPLFFVISGYLFFKNYEGISSYKKKIKRRLHSLVIPYIFWNTMMIFFYALIQSIPSLSQYFSGANKPISDYNIFDYIQAFWAVDGWHKGNGTPILQPYWYVRNLFLLCLSSPFLYLFIKKTWLLVLIPLILWISANHVAFGFSSIAFFSLGGVFCIHNSILQQFIKSNYVSFLLLFLASTIIDFCFIGSGEIAHIIHRINLICGMIFLFKSAICLSNKISIPKKLTDSSFLIYTLHLPILLALRKIGVKMFSTSNGFIQLVIYFTCILITITIIVLIFDLLKKYFPKLLTIINGR